MTGGISQPGGIPESGPTKAELRRRLRVVRRSLDDVAERTVELWSHVRDEPAVRAARAVMIYDAMPGEPDTHAFEAWLVGAGKHVVKPASTPTAAWPADPASLDVVIVPGLGFTAEGVRLGQGVGWYDRFLAEVRDDCTAIGVAFAEQVVASLPTDDHDRRVDVVVTDEGRVRSPPVAPAPNLD